MVVGSSLALMTDELSDFDAFALASAPRMRRLAFLLTGDEHHAEDLAQIALAKIYFSWRRLQSADAPDAYARRVLINAASTWRRRRWRGELPVAVLPELGRAEPSAEERDVLVRALRQLPVRQRAVLVLRFYEDLPEAQVAAILGVPVGTVKSQQSRGLARLRALLGDEPPADTVTEARA